MPPSIDIGTKVLAETFADSAETGDFAGAFAVGTVAVADTDGGRGRCYWTC